MDVLNGRGRAVGYMFEIAWGGLAMQRNSLGFLGFQYNRLPFLKIFGEGLVGISQYQTPGTREEYQKDVHIIVLTNVSQDYQVFLKYKIRDEQAGLSCYDPSSLKGQ